MALSADAAAGTLRIAVGRFTSAAEIEFAADTLIEAHRTCRR
jgi:cysteine sulfinate desulfinase/cysteine desulfurase-like protein